MAATRALRLGEVRPVQAFRSLVRTILSKSDLELASWRNAFLEALGPNGRLMADLVPELNHRHRHINGIGGNGWLRRAMPTARDRVYRGHRFSG
jgi:predicted ATPase